MLPAAVVWVPAAMVTACGFPPEVTVVLSSEKTGPAAVLLVPPEIVTGWASPPICGTAATAAVESNPSASVDIAPI